MCHDICASVHMRVYAHMILLVRRATSEGGRDTGCSMSTGATHESHCSCVQSLLLDHAVCACVQIHEEAQRKAEAEAAAVLEERQKAGEDAARMAAAAKQRAQSMHQIQAQQESEAKKKCALLPFCSCHVICSRNAAAQCISVGCRSWLNLEAVLTAHLYPVISPCHLTCGAYANTASLSWPALTASGFSLVC